MTNNKNTERYYILNFTPPPTCEYVRGGAELCIRKLTNEESQDLLRNQSEYAELLAEFLRRGRSPDLMPRARMRIGDKALIVTVLLRLPAGEENDNTHADPVIIDFALAEVRRAR